jgi:hypothetical protein
MLGKVGVETAGSRFARFLHLVATAQRYPRMTGEPFALFFDPLACFASWRA